MLAAIVADTAASDTAFTAFSDSGIQLVGDWLANPVLLPVPGTRYDWCADPEGPVEPTPLPGGGTRRVPYPPIMVRVVAGCAPPPPGVCAP